jgi:hypothetical protein
MFKFREIFGHVKMLPSVLVSSVSIAALAVLIVTLIVPITPAYSAITIITRDLDGDGKKDIRFHVDGTKVKMVDYNLDENFNNYDLRVSDTNNDGAANVMCVDTNNNGTFEAAECFSFGLNRTRMPPPPGTFSRDFENFDGDPKPESLFVSWKSGAPAEFATFDSNNDGRQDLVDLFRTNDGTGSYDVIELQNTGGTANYDRVVQNADGTTITKTFSTSQKAALPGYFVAQTDP